MKKLYIKALAALAITGSVASCGDSFLDTDMYDAIDINTGLNNVTNIGYAVNGAYNRLYRYYFAGNYATSIGDIASDISYWNTKTGHFNAIYQFIPTPDDTYLYYIWNYGYKVADNTARIIKAGNELYAGATPEEQAELDLYLAEAYALRAYGHFVLVNVFGHQIKVNGTDYSSQPGIVVVSDPIPAGAQVSRSTVGDAYTSIINDLKSSLNHFANAGGDKGSMFYMNPAAVHGLLSRVYLYMENYADAATEAQAALDLKGITSLVTTADEYKALYNYGQSNSESFFALAITQTENWSANSCGTLWSTYNYSPSPYLKSIMAAGDVRRAVWGEGAGSTEEQPVFNGGKFAAFAFGNPAYGTNYLINAPEMFLNQAEAYAKLGQITPAQNALLTVAKRNPAITSVSDLPSTADGLMAFIKEERARELFQEGLRLYDLRRWGQPANAYATGAPDVNFFVKNFDLSNIVFPIPADEINAGYGVEQTPNWNTAFPTM